MNIRWQTWLAAGGMLFFTLIIFLADRNALPGPITSLYAFPYGDKVGHFCLMGSLSFCLNLGLHCRKVPLLGRTFLLGSLLAAALVTLEEFSQYFIAVRSFDPLDLLASLAGIALLGRAADRLVQLLRQFFSKG